MVRPRHFRPGGKSTATPTHQSMGAAPFHGQIYDSSASSIRDQKGSGSPTQSLLRWSQADGEAGFRKQISLLKGDGMNFSVPETCI